MKKYFDSIIDGTGAPVFGASILVLNYGTSTPSTLFSDAAGTVPLLNPVVSNSVGYFEFYAADGRYSINITGPSFTPITITDILLEDPTNPSPLAATNLSYTGTLTGGTGVVNLGSGQIVKDGAGNVSIPGTVTAGTVVANLTGSTADGTNLVGFRNIPPNPKSAAYLITKADAGKNIRHPNTDATARVYTIDSNANQTWVDGTAITITNKNGAGVITIAVTTDTMRLAGAGTTGSRTLAANGVATAVFDAVAVDWLISGVGLT